jgi:hypothetical protein
MTRQTEAINPRRLEQFHAVVARRIDPALEKLQSAGLRPSSPRVQRLIVQHQKLMREYQVREAAMQWLASAASRETPGSDQRAAHLRPTLSQALRRKLKQRPTQDSPVISSQWLANPFLIEYFATAERQSAQCKAVDALVRSARRALDAGLKAGSAKADRLAARFLALCEAHHLGDARTYARWAEELRPPPANLLPTADRRVWRFMSDLVRRRTAIS